MSTLLLTAVLALPLDVTAWLENQDRLPKFSKRKLFRSRWQ